IDTGGIEQENNNQKSFKSFETNWIVKNIGLGLKEADLILFVVDGKEGLNPLDKTIFKWIKIKFSNKPIILLVNKADDRNNEVYSLEFYELGLENIIQVSALHNLGFADLLNTIIEHIKPTDETKKNKKISLNIDETDIKFALVGKPNVGKSSILNQILGEERVLVSDIPGTTRDAIDTFIEKDEIKFTIIDTAGIKKNSKKKDFDFISIAATEEAIKRSDISLLVMDATTGVNHQDLRIAGMIKEYNRASIIVINKWDLIENREEYVKKFLDDRKKLFPFLLHSPVIFVSAKTKIRIHKIFDIVKDVYKEYTKRIPDIEISNLFRECYSKKYPPRGKKKYPIVILGGKQLETKPPLFYVKLNKDGELHTSYKRYLENNIREKYGFVGTPVKIIWRGE
ncbi:MAG: ribosome biogenesis GTPase Der, partial [Elusimicrobiota bacterium]|nr:ribosome biogenesis GTPase Der [Elusimicrobiota bacterium]